MTAGSDRDLFNDDIDDFDAREERPVAYRSPVMSRLSGSGKLTLESLRRDVPLFQAGREAAERLDNDLDLSETDRDALQRAVYDGDRAKERLVLAGIPLIKHLAQKEHTRRQNWQSQVTYDDLFQEGVGGLLRGLMAYKVDGGQKSPTNYLGQWIMVEMRRNVEASDNDFGVPFDKAERFRKIRALRSRLASELGREPTDEEILEASNDPMFRGGKKMGRVNKSATPSPRRQLTMAQLAEERAERHRFGHTSRFSSGNDSEEYDGPSPDAGRSLHSDTTVDAAAEVVERGAQEGLARLLQQTLDVMRLPSVQRDVIARRYGLPPHEKEESGRDISRALNLHRERVGRVIEAFTEEMSRPGGSFHKVCSTLTTDDLADLGLGWVESVLGDWGQVPEAAKTVPVPDVLTTPLVPRKGTVAPPPESPTMTARGPQVRGQFVCDYHGWDFIGVYARREDVPRSRNCPQCGRPSELVRLLAA